MRTYSLSGDDNGTYMWGSSTTLQHAAPDLKVCEACGTKLDAALVRPTYECGKCRLDASSTYDNYLIVSAAFRDVVIGRDLTGARFTVLPAAPGFYVLDAPNIVAFDVERRRTHFAKHCDTCNRYLEVAGATPAFAAAATESSAATAAVPRRMSCRRPPLAEATRVPSLRTRGSR